MPAVLSTTVFPVDIELTNEQVEQIRTSVAKDTPIASKVAGMARGLVEDFMEGGMMFPASVVERIRAVTELEDPEDVVDIVERGADKMGAKDVYPVAIDPVYRGGLEEHANFQSVDVKYLITDMVNYGLDNSWQYEMPADVYKIRFSDEDSRMISQILGKPEGERFTGTELANFLRGELLGTPVEIGEGPPLLEGDDPVEVPIPEAPPDEEEQPPATTASVLARIRERWSK